MLPTKTYHWGLLLAVLAVTTAMACDGAEEDQELRGADRPTVEGSMRILSVSLEEAQELVDFSIAQPADLPPDVNMVGVRVRTSALDPERVVSIELHFKGAGYGFSLMESTASEVSIGGSTEPVMINGVEGRIRRHERSDGRILLSVAWRKGTLSFIASGFLEEKLTERVLLEILESIP